MITFWMPKENSCMSTYRCFMEITIGQKPLNSYLKILIIRLIGILTDRKTILFFNFDFNEDTI